MEPIRIQKYLSSCGILSRRAAEEAIRAGDVTVNGKQAEIGQKINAEKDVVLCFGKKIASFTNQKIYLMLNKPRGYLTTMHDERNRKCVAELVSDVGARVYPVGRLDKDSEGLLLFTNDGDFANTLMHPRHEIPKIYYVKIQGTVTPEQLRQLSGIREIDGYAILPVSPEIIEINDDSTILRFTLYEGRNRQIRKMCDAVHLTILRLKRVAIGDISLGNLKLGKWKYLSSSQIRYLTERKK